MDLFDLVNSFIEKGYGVAVDEEEMVDDEYDDGDCEDSDVKEMKDSLKRLFSYENGDETRRKTSVEIQKAWKRVMNDSSSSDFKLQLIAQLREQGLDAGVCKTKWGKSGKVPAGDYEYMDVNMNGRRYIIEVSLASEFGIARPTQSYSELLDVFPQVAVCKLKELKQIVRIMCDAIANSMKHRRMHVPPWRRHAYVEAKWFASYKRITIKHPDPAPQPDRAGSIVAIRLL